jgi:ribosomal protein RSM22 (predicted rRNA methylase)
MASRLPEALYQAIQTRLSGVPLRTLQAGYDLLSRDYRGRTVSEQERRDLAQATAPKPGAGRLPAGYAPAEGRALGYLAARLPATYAAAQFALRQVPDAVLAGAESVLDLGAGPGTATWALLERWPGLKQATWLERDKGMLVQGQALAAAFPQLKVTALESDLSEASALTKLEAHDIVLWSYGLSELPEAQQVETLERAWALAKIGLLVVEPGTPAASGRLLQLRKHLIGLGAFVAAPCPQNGTCPLAGLPATPEKPAPWCHFGERLERRGLHKLVKGGDRGYEDEKFSYFFFAKEKPAYTPPMRLLAGPRRVNRHINLDVCNADGKREAIFLNRRDTPYHIRHAARQMNWGFAWDPAKVPVTEGQNEGENEDD